MELLGNSVAWKVLAHVIFNVVSRTILSVKVLILWAYLVEIGIISSSGILKQKNPYETHLKRNAPVHSQSHCPS